MNLAYINSLKNKNKDARIEIELKNENTFILHPKRMDRKLLKTISSVCRVDSKYEILISKVSELETLNVELCMPPKAVMKELESSSKFEFNEEFKQTELYKTMFDYQKEGVKTVITKFNGKALIGDEMGLGKTLQALSLFKYYNPNKLVVICPAYLRYTWRREINKWCCMESTVINTGKDTIDGNVVIISYELATKKVSELKDYEMVVCDESHYLKGHKTKRTKTLTPYLKKTKYCILLTGTPALNRPYELYAQAHILRPDIYRSFKSYTQRYCNGHVCHLGFYDFSGSSNANELNWISHKSIMIRRLKRDVLTELPSKNRSEIYVNPTKRKLKPLDPLFKKWNTLNEKISAAVPGSDEIAKLSFERKVLIMEMYRTSSQCKVDSVKKIVKDMVSQGLKFIVFCYHKKFMDEIETVCNSYIRIDGSTPHEKRQEYVDEFQNGEKDVAILSLLAASTGLTLTASSIVVFAELYFVPGTMLQAEDRIHRIGQKNACDIRYIIAEKTLDDYIFRMIVRKLDTLDTFLDGRDDRKFLGKRQKWDGLDEMDQK